MRKIPFTLALLYCFFLLYGRVYGIGEKIIAFGASSSWEFLEKRQGITEVPLIRPNPVLVVAGNNGEEALLDLCLSFDEGQPGNFADSRGRYNITVSPELSAASAPLSRSGAASALFAGNTRAGLEPLVLKPRPAALFAPGSRIRDFSVEFWLYPLNLENGEQIFSWASSGSDGRGGYVQQRIQCVALRSRTQWVFDNFFFSPGPSVRGGTSSKTVSLTGPLLLNRTWSHHLIRFDADLGLLEYLVDGRLEALEYTSSTGREGGEVYTPVIGEDSRIALGSRFSGMMDEFRIYSAFLEKATLAKYPERGGRIETRTLDLGHSNSRVLRIEAFGGRTSDNAGKIRNEYSGNSPLKFPDHSEIKFFIRSSSSSYRWNDVLWIPVNPGTELPILRGRYVQIAADFYPSADGETSPYLSEFRIVYDAADPPPPPTHLTALANNGAVELSWKASASSDVGGYLVYYGTAKGEYFGGPILESPINVGNRTSVRIDGLKNGTIYYFAVAAYADNGMVLREPGEFSREAAARPLPLAAEGYR